MTSGTAAENAAQLRRGADRLRVERDRLRRMGQRTRAAALDVEASDLLEEAARIDGHRDDDPDPPVTRHSTDT